MNRPLIIATDRVKRRFSKLMGRKAPPDYGLPEGSVCGVIAVNPDFAPDAFARCLTIELDALRDVMIAEHARLREEAEAA